MTQSNSHGGAREGAGRKKMDAGKKQRITFTLSDDVIDFLKSKRPASRTLELAVREYANRLEQDHIRRVVGHNFDSATNTGYLLLSCNHKLDISDDDDLALKTARCTSCYLYDRDSPPQTKKLTGK